MRERDSNSYIHEMDGFSVLFLGPQATLERRHEELFLFQLHCFFFGGGVDAQKMPSPAQNGTKGADMWPSTEWHWHSGPCPKKKRANLFFMCDLFFADAEHGMVAQNRHCFCRVLRMADHSVNESCVSLFSSMLFAPRFSRSFSRRFALHLCQVP